MSAEPEALQDGARVLQDNRATHCNTLQRCNTLQHTATHMQDVARVLQDNHVCAAGQPQRLLLTS